MNNIPEGYRHAVEVILKAMRHFMGEGQEIHGMAFLGKGDYAPVPVPMKMETDKDKDISAAVIREVVKETGAEYVIMISEGWTLPKDTPPEEFEAILKKYGGQISKCPQRQEIIFLTLETPRGTWMGISPIKSLGDGKRGFDDMEFILSTNMEGRFTHFLSPNVH